MTDAFSLPFLLGGTLYECGVALKSLGAASVSAFVAHSVFPNDSWKRYEHTHIHVYSIYLYMGDEHRNQSSVDVI